MKFLSLKEASDKLTAAGFTVTLVSYDKGVHRKGIDLRAQRVIQPAECAVNCQDPQCPYLHKPVIQSVTFFNWQERFGPNEIDNAIAGLHKYAGMSFAGKSWPADAPWDYEER